MLPEKVTFEGRPKVAETARYYLGGERAFLGKESVSAKVLR